MLSRSDKNTLVAIAVTAGVALVGAFIVVGTYVVAHIQQLNAHH